MMLLGPPETIFALATPPGRAALAVFRVSGEGAHTIVRSMVGKLPKPRMATLAKLRDPFSEQTIDHALVYWFPGPESFTGEDCVEFSIHGSRAIVAKLYRVLGRFPRTRIAGPGEFSRRALENGKMSLLEVESLADLISAETEQQRLLGIDGLSGKLRNVVERWREQLLAAVVNVEVSLDFSDDADADAYDTGFIVAICDDVCKSIAKWLSRRDQGPLLRSGFTILISGPPNAGKSTLLNEMARRDVAIVSDLPGTTRDLLEVHLDLSGYLVNLVDSAGMRDAADAIESIGISRAIERAKSANLILWLCDHSERVSPPPEFGTRPVWRVYTKCDTSRFMQDEHPDVDDKTVFIISAMTGHNLEQLLGRLGEFVACNLAEEADVVAVNERQALALENAQESLRQIVEGICLPEIVATKLREAIVELEILIGRIGVEDVLAEIFSRFCIGK
jgi:tRNA modification GTPase